MPVTYSEHVRKNLAEEGDQRRTREIEESMNRISEYKGKMKEQLQKQKDILEAKQKKELEQIQKETDEKLKKIRNDEEIEKKNFEKRSAEIKKAADEELEERKKVYEDIIEKNKEILKKEKLETERELLKTEEDLREIRDSLESTIVGEREKLDGKRKKINDEQMERNEKKFEEIIEKQNEKKKIEIETLKEVAVKKDELLEKRALHLNDFQNSNLKTQMNMFTTNQIINDQYNNGVMNDLVRRLQAISDDISRSYRRCRSYFEEGRTWNDADIKRARESFESLSGLFQKSRRELTDTERKLADLDNDENTKQMACSIKEMRAKLFSLDSCLSVFCGKLMAKITNWRDEEKNELIKLMDEFSKIEFPTFDAKNRELQNHLRNCTPAIPETSNTRSIQQ